jgi:hypothetical protein
MWCAIHTPVSHAHPICPYADANQHPRSGVRGYAEVFHHSHLLSMSVAANLLIHLAYIRSTLSLLLASICLFDSRSIAPCCHTVGEYSPYPLLELSDIAEVIQRTTFF